jgi:hypothetical protein
MKPETINIIELVLSAITALAIVFAAIQIKINRKQLYLSTITKCIADFRKLGILNKDTKKLKIIDNYVDLTNEELFYIQHKYIPKTVAKEWIDGMIDFIPIINKKGEVLNSQSALKRLVDDRKLVAQRFPRIENAFKIAHKYNFELIYATEENMGLKRTRERQRLIDEIMANIRKSNRLS